MIKNIYICTVYIASSAACLSATLDIDNFTGGSQPELLIQTTGGALIGNDAAASGATSIGFVSLYEYSGSVPSTVSEVIANGNNGLLDLVPLTDLNSLQGQVTSQFTFDDGPRAALGLLIGNGSDVGTSSEFALFEFIATGGVQVLGNPQAFDAYEIASADLVPSIGEVVAVGGADRIQLSAVPEPSTALLGLLGLGFLARRRR